MWCEMILSVAAVEEAGIDQPRQAAEFRTASEREPDLVDRFFLGDVVRELAVRIGCTQTGRSCSSCGERPAGISCPTAARPPRAEHLDAARAETMARSISDSVASTLFIGKER